MWKGQDGIFSNISYSNIIIRPKTKRQRQIENTPIKLMK